MLLSITQKEALEIVKFGVKKALQSDEQIYLRPPEVPIDMVSFCSQFVRNEAVTALLNSKTCSIYASIQFQKH